MQRQQSDASFVSESSTHQRTASASSTPPSAELVAADGEAEDPSLLFRDCLGIAMKFQFFIDIQRTVHTNGTKRSHGRSASEPAQRTVTLPVLLTDPRDGQEHEPIIVRSFPSFWRHMNFLDLKSLRNDVDSGLHFFVHGAYQPNWESLPHGGSFRVEAKETKVQQLFERLAAALIITRMYARAESGSHPQCMPMASQVVGISAGLDAVKVWLKDVRNAEQLQIRRVFGQYFEQHLEKGLHLSYTLHRTKLDAVAAGIIPAAPALPPPTKVVVGAESSKKSPSSRSGSYTKTPSPPPAQLSPNLGAESPPTPSPEPEGGVLKPEGSEPKPARPVLNVTSTSRNATRRTQSSYVPEGSWSKANSISPVLSSVPPPLTSPLLQALPVSANFAQPYPHQRSESLASIGSNSTATTATSTASRKGRRGCRGGKKKQLVKGVSEDSASTAEVSGASGHHSPSGSGGGSASVPIPIRVPRHGSYGELDEHDSLHRASDSTAQLMQMHPPDSTGRPQLIPIRTPDDDEGSVVERSVDDDDVQPQYYGYDRSYDGSLTQLPSTPSILIKGEKKPHYRTVSFGDERPGNGSSSPNGSTSLVGAPAAGAGVKGMSPVVPLPPAPMRHDPYLTRQISAPTIGSEEKLPQGSSRVRTQSPEAALPATPPEVVLRPSRAHLSKATAAQVERPEEEEGEDPRPLETEVTSTSPLKQDSTNPFCDGAEEEGDSSNVGASVETMEGKDDVPLRRGRDELPADEADGLPSEIAAEDHSPSTTRGSRGSSPDEPSTAPTSLNNGSMHEAPEREEDHSEEPPAPSQDRRASDAGTEEYSANSTPLSPPPPQRSRRRRRSGSGRKKGAMPKAESASLSDLESESGCPPPPERSETPSPKQLRREKRASQGGDECSSADTSPHSVESTQQSDAQLEQLRREGAAGESTPKTVEVKAGGSITPMVLIIVFLSGVAAAVGVMTYLNAIEHH